MNEALEPEVLPKQTTAQYASKAAGDYVDKGIDSLLKFTQSEGAQKVLSDLGLQSTVKDVNKEMIKNALAAYALIKLFGSVRENIFKLGILGLGIYLATQNKAKIQTAIAELQKNVQSQIA